MLVLFIYVLGLLFLSYILRKKSSSFRSTCIIIYNYFFIIPIYYFAQVPENPTFQEALSLLLVCAYKAPGAMAFGANLGIVSDPAIIILFYFMSLYMARTVMVVLFRKAMAMIVVKIRMLYHTNVYVLTGQLEDAKALIEEIKENVKHPVIIYKTTKSQSDEFIPGVLLDPRPLSKIINSKKKYTVVLLPEERNNNIIYLQELEEIGQKISDLKVTAFVNNDVLRYEDLCYPHLNVYLVSKESLLTRSFLLDNLPIKTLISKKQGEWKNHVFTPEIPFSTCIIGFESLSKEFLLETMENASFKTKTCPVGFDITVIDDHLDEKKAAFFREVPHMKEESTLAFIDAKAGSEKCFEVIEKEMKHCHSILIDTLDTQKNVDIALSLYRLFKRQGLEENHPQLIVVMYEANNGGIELLSKNPGGIFLQNNPSLFTYRDLVLRELDKKAESLHQQYNKSSLKDASWQSLGTFKQDSNRAVIFDIPNKLAMVDDFSYEPQEVKEEIYWKLASYEHLRWNMFHYAHGWIPLKVEELSKEEIETYQTKKASSKKHLCLVDWDDLDALPQKRPGLLKYYDYENILALFEKQS